MAKHADAHHVAVTLTHTPDGVQLSIVDDGKGFDLAGARGTGAGLGLVSIDERARLLEEASGSIHSRRTVRGFMSGFQVRPNDFHLRLEPLDAAPVRVVTVA